MLQTYQMKKTSKDPRVLLAVMLVLCIGVSFGYVREGEEGILHQVQGAICSVVQPLTKAGAHLELARADAADAITNATASDATLSELREENESLRRQLADAEEYRQEAERLEGLLNISEKYSFTGTVACVIGRTSEAYDQAVTIDAGSADGIVVGQSVMGPNGVIGQIISVSDHSSTVRLLTDP